MTTIRIEGLAELERKLRALPKRLQGRALSTAMRAGAREIVKEVKARAPVDSGALKRNIGAKRGRRQFDRGLAGRQIIGVRHGRMVSTRKLKNGRLRVRTDDPFYYRFQEAGFTAVGRRKAAGRLERRARKAGLGNARFVPGRKFLARGLAAAEPRALLVIRNRLALEIERLT